MHMLPQTFFVTYFSIYYCLHEEYHSQHPLSTLFQANFYFCCSFSHLLIRQMFYPSIPTSSRKGLTCFIYYSMNWYGLVEICGRVFRLAVLPMLWYPLWYPAGKMLGWRAFVGSLVHMHKYESINFVLWMTSEVACTWPIWKHYALLSNESWEIAEIPSVQWLFMATGAILALIL